jgi:hypothetical protein
VQRRVVEHGVGSCGVEVDQKTAPANGLNGDLVCSGPGDRLPSRNQIVMAEPLEEFGGA